MNLTYNIRNTVAEQEESDKVKGTFKLNKSAPKLLQDWMAK